MAPVTCLDCLAHQELGLTAAGLGRAQVPPTSLPRRSLEQMPARPENRAARAGVAPAGDTRRRVNVVPHTHWDREWYSPFRTFQLRLVDLVDELLGLMEADPSYSRFLLDGQMAVVDDYLELRPENEGRLRRLAAAKRLTFGPWYILMDEFLVSGETIVRNLELGLERAAVVRGRDGGRLPPRHVRPRGPDATALGGGRLRPRGRLARRPIRGRQDGLRLGGS